ncbi:MFS transporter [Sinorhizobium meliloti]|uniref:MFS transporter n=1 Tax=Rhizobium meliloti TaxID=382 RepID=UPI00041BF452|nr:MFS transporter [Sinorhizobium meliloti]
MPLFFYILLSGHIAFVTSTIVIVTILTWHTTQISPSISDIALIQVTQSLPLALLSIVFGTVADRISRRSLLILSQSACLVATIIFAVLASLHPPTIPLILTYTALLGVATALVYPCWQATLGDLAPTPHLRSAVSLNITAFNISRVTAPLAASMLIVLAGVPWALGISSLGFAIFLCGLFRWTPAAQRANASAHRFFYEVFDSVKYVRHRREIVTALFWTCVFAVHTSFAATLLPAVISLVTDGSATSFGLVTACFGLGAIIAGLASLLWQQAVNRHLVIPLSLVGLCCHGVMLASADSFSIVALAAIVGGLSWVTGFIYLNSSVQMLAPRDYAGRLMAFYQTANALGLAFGGWLWGMLADLFGLLPTLFLISAQSALLALLLTFGRTPRLKG